MITFENITNCNFSFDIKVKLWLNNTIREENKIPGDISYIFCDDEYIYNQNIKFLNHDTFTDIITFDYTNGNIVAGSILISLDRVNENADKFDADKNDELLRVLVHGILHLCGYTDKTDDEAKVMRNKENYYIQKYKSNL